MPSKRRLAPVITRDGIGGGSSAREQEVPVIEIDTTFGRVLGLTEGQKVYSHFTQSTDVSDRNRLAYFYILILRWLIQLTLSH
jgi:hypothetical protein